jgi:nitronate monooxygenase
LASKYMENPTYEKGMGMPKNDCANAGWRRTRSAQLLGIEYPIVQAPFGGFPRQQLAATVSNVGGLGSLGAVALGASAIRDAIAEIRALTARPFAVNLWVSTSDREASRVAAETIEESLRTRYRASVLHRGQAAGLRSPGCRRHGGRCARAQLHLRHPEDVLTECRERAIRTAGAATTPDEAMALDDAGLDLIVASGVEGGGHRGSFLRPAAESLIGSVSLIPQVVDAVCAPVIATGGIADARGVAVAIALGAERVQIGTAFLPCIGSGCTRPHRQALLSEAAKRTGLTDALTGRLARGLRNRLMDELEDRRSLPFPLQHAVPRPARARRPNRARPSS